ncbi:hypothetical protein JOD64_001554 [Micromonospora luteifusca]|uniref:Uncharacterized protein n=1 Tax=Micromonospora luteifusca TaxID=709860 RepID=A0ABS2LQD5_9ACTN|nr:hypothetical protein [Micromonospora luteifusca]MBM7490332.1 hypothetical protein [Micromonospora luteifusca]
MGVIVVVSVSHEPGVWSPEIIIRDPSSRNGRESHTSSYLPEGVRVRMSVGEYAGNYMKYGPPSYGNA